MYISFWVSIDVRGHCGRDRMVVGYTTTCVISVYHHYSCEFESYPWRGVLDTTLCDKVCQWLATGRRLSPGTPDRDYIAEQLLKVALKTQTLTLTPFKINVLWICWQSKHLNCQWNELALVDPNFRWLYILFSIYSFTTGGY